MQDWDKPLEPFKELIEKMDPSIKVEILKNKLQQLRKYKWKKYEEVI